MKIGIIGSGNMGRALGVRFAQLGHEVMFGARRADQASVAAELAGNGASAGPNDEAATFGDVLIWTMRETDPGAVLATPSVLAGKIIIDVNNRDYGREVREGVWFSEAIAECLQKAAPAAAVVKAFNTIAMESFDISPEHLRAVGAQTFIAGDSGPAKALVGELSAQLGFQAVDVGAGPAAFRAAEALGDVIRLVMIDGGRGGRAHLKLEGLPAPDLNRIGARSPSDYG